LNPKSADPLEAALRAALAGSSPQQPAQIGALRRLGAPDAVDAALLTMYQNGEVGCCLVTKKTTQHPQGVRRGCRADESATTTQHSLWWMARNNRPITTKGYR